MHRFFATLVWVPLLTTLSCSSDSVPAVPSNDGGALTDAGTTPDANPDAAAPADLCPTTEAPPTCTGDCAAVTLQTGAAPGFALDATHLFFAGSPSTLDRASRLAPAAAETVAPVRVGTGALTVDGTSLYAFTDDGLLVKLAAGGPGTQIPQTVWSAPDTVAVSLRSDSSGTYFAALHRMSKLDQPTSAEKAGIWHVTGGVATQLTTKAPGGYGIAVDDAHVFYSDGMQTVYATPKPGTAGDTVAVVSAAATSVAVDCGSIYWISREDNSLHRAPKSGGGITRFSPSDFRGAFELAVDAHRLYWSSPPDGTTRAGVWACALPGCTTSQRLVSLDEAPRELRVTADSVYFSTAGNAVQRIVK